MIPKRKIEMSISRVAVPLFFFASLPGIVYGHAGHGNDRDGNSFLHYAMSPLHLLAFLIAAVLITSIALFFRLRLASAKARR